MHTKILVVFCAVQLTLTTLHGTIVPDDIRKEVYAKELATLREINKLHANGQSLPPKLQAILERQKESYAQQAYGHVTIPLHLQLKAIENSPLLLEEDCSPLECVHGFTKKPFRKKKATPFARKNSLTQYQEQLLDANDQEHTLKSPHNEEISIQQHRSGPKRLYVHGRCPHKPSLSSWKPHTRLFATAPGKGRILGEKKRKGKSGK